MIASNAITNNDFSTMIPYPNNVNISLCRNNNPYTKPNINDVPELIAEKSSSASVSSGSTEEINFLPNSTSLNTTKLDQELNPFEQSFETSQNKMKTTSPFTTMPARNNVTFKKGNQKPSKRAYDKKDEEKRKNFLERNRIAALKCRQRKKQWLQNLQTRVEYLAADNEQYYIQINALREELVNLKMLLLAHKECPMDQQAIRNALNQTIPAATAPVASQMMTFIPPN